MNLEVVTSLLRICVGTYTKQADQTLESANETDWKEALELLSEHELLPLLAYRIAHGSHGTSTPHLSSRTHDTVELAYARIWLRNTCLLTSLRCAVASLQEARVDPILLKGVPLLELVYPDIGARALGDADILIPRESMRDCAVALEKAGFARAPHLDEADAIHYQNAEGMLLDVHHRFRLFEGLSLAALTEDAPFSLLKLPHVRVFKPNPFVVHLAFHLEGHRTQKCYHLKWLVDLALAVRQWSPVLDMEVIRSLSPTRTAITKFLRLVRFFDESLGLETPPCLSNACRNVHPLTLGAIVSGWRMAQWELQKLRGWGRMSSCLLGISDWRGRQIPRLPDAVTLLTDRVRLKLSMRKPPG